ncbi:MULTISPECIES: PG0541 family transporter-associated protein [Aminobacterium]|jgi:hypothetical protein|uniref:PG0541 family transporter-associated protein n=1 Tax=Aminobacterium TaxID=81466 RepID=UPI000466C1F9|nr:MULTISPECIES: PG0541 family transporter-associated protein [Aminobacterium]
MKMFWIFCNESVAEDLMEVLNKNGITGYFVWKNVLFRDNVSGKTHWDDAIYPGKDWAFMVFCGDEDVLVLKEKLTHLEEEPYIKQAGIKAFVAEAEKVL